MGGGDLLLCAVYCGVSFINAKRERGIQSGRASRGRVVVFYLAWCCSKLFLPPSGGAQTSYGCNVGGAMLSVANAVRFYADAFIVARAGVVV